ncbi:MAG: biotin--[acetyl-CoA-carboxylase] ligase [Alphaproteobacteria bacterium]|nr:biotin--[acetyl-CoA-carboxylase] ligase [Alphaproteobacteria bacterium]
MPLDPAKLKHFKFPSVDSTNSVGAELARGGVALASVRADIQTAGRTTKSDTVWESKPGDLFYTFVFKMPPALEKHFSNLSLIAATAIVSTLKSMDPSLDLGIKWPNDILLGGKKLAGILIEKEGDSAIVGIGINVKNFPDIKITKYPATSLAAAGFDTTPKDIAAILELELIKLVNIWENDGFGQILGLSREYLYRLGETVEIESLGSSYNGIFEGIANNGAIVINVDGTPREFLSGNLKVQLKW